MSETWDFPQEQGYAYLTNDNPSIELVTDPSPPSDEGRSYLWMEKLAINVAIPSSGGGILELFDSQGTVKWSTSTDGVKDSVVDLGPRGVRLGENYGLTAVVSGSQTEQATVSVAFVGHLTVNLEK